MVNVNLTTSQTTAKKEVALKGGARGIIAAVIVLVLAYLGIRLYEAYLDKKIGNLDGAYEAERQNLMAGDNENVVDFQNRISMAKNLVSRKNNALDGILEIEKKMIGGIYLASYAFDESKNTVELKMVADNFNVLARQLLSFKESSYFSETAPGNASLNDNGKVEALANLTIK